MEPEKVTRIEKIYNLIAERDMDAFEIVRLTGIERQKVKYFLYELINSDRIFKYKLRPEKHNSRMCYTVDESKAMEEPEEKPKDVIKGARVFMMGDRSRYETLRAIARSQSKKIEKNNPGTSWVHMEMAL